MLHDYGNMNPFWLTDPRDRLQDALSSLEHLESPPNESMFANKLDYVQLTNYALAIDSSTGSWAAAKVRVDELKHLLQKLADDSSQGIARQKLFRRNILRTANSAYLPPTIFSGSGHNLPRRYLFIIETTERCNLACVYCFKSATSSGTDLQTETAEQIARYINSHDYPVITVEFAGGEPTLNLDAIALICKRLNSDTQRKFIFTVQTNATNISNKFLALARRFDIKVSASMDGSELELARNRPFASGRSAAAKIFDGLAHLTKAGCLTGIVSVHSSRTISTPSEFLKTATQLGITRIKYNNSVPVGRGQQISTKLSESNQAYLEYLTALVLLGLKEKTPVLENNTFHIAQRIINRIPTYRCSNSPCDAGYTFQSIRPNGDIYPCDRYTGRPETRLGNIFDNATAQDLDLSRRNAVVRSLANRNIQTVPRCSACNIRAFCGAGCGMESFDVHGNFAMPSALCEFYSLYIPQVFEWILTNEQFRTAYCGLLDRTSI